MKPQVSAIVPTYNRAGMIGSTIESVLGQTFRDLELIVVDDGSTDDTKAVIKGYVESSELPIRYLHKPNGGCASARNKGIEHAGGRYIAFLDSDDQWLPNAIESMWEALRHSGADFVYSPVLEVLEDGCEFLAYPAAAGTPETFAREHFLTTNARPCSLLYNRIVFQTERFNEQVRYNEDSDFLQRVAVSFTGCYLPAATARVFHHGGNKSSNRVEILKALRQSAQQILHDFPTFAETLGEAGQERLDQINGELLEELIEDGKLPEAIAAAGASRKLRPALAWSLRLKSVLPLRLERLKKNVLDEMLFDFKIKKRKTTAVKAFHVFNAYLQQTENWCHRLIKYLPDTVLYIVSDTTVNSTSFPLVNAVFLLRPSIEWPLLGHPAFKFGLRCARGMVDILWGRLLKHCLKGVDLIHAHFSYVGWNWLELAEKRNIPLVVSFYGFDYEFLPNRDPEWRDRYPELFKRGSLFLAEGEFGRRTLISMGCPEEKVRVARLGVETACIPFFRRSKRENELRLVQIATFISKKGHDTTVHAFIKALERCPEMTLTLVGRDPEGLSAPLKRLVATRGLEHRIEFIDGIDFSKLHLFMGDFHVFIHPSRYGQLRDSEGGAPVVLLDAQATGMPILSTRHCDIPGVVVDGETGVLVGEDQVDGLAQAIEYFYRMPEGEYSAFCRRARRHVVDHFDSVQCGARLKEEYDRLLGKDRP